MVRVVKISQPEFESIRKLYEAVMSYACHGLFFREGSELADQVVADIEGGAEMLEGAKEALISRGWIEDLTWGEKVHVRGSIEVSPGAGVETCHRLRGALSRLASKSTNARVRFAEVECESAGNPECVFVKEEG